MRDMLTSDRIQIEGIRAHAPYILVGSPQAGSIQHLLQTAHVRFNLRTHGNSPDVMFEIDPGADMVSLQRMLDQAE